MDQKPASSASILGVKIIICLLAGVIVSQIPAQILLATGLPPDLVVVVGFGTLILSMVVVWKLLGNMRFSKKGEASPSVSAANRPVDKPRLPPQQIFHDPPAIGNSRIGGANFTAADLDGDYGFMYTEGKTRDGIWLRDPAVARDGPKLLFLLMKMEIPRNIINQVALGWYKIVPPDDNPMGVTIIWWNMEGKPGEMPPMPPINNLFG
jgi:hypothetical protein